MGLFDAIGTIAGGIGGFALGGPFGALAGASIGSTVDQLNAASDLEQVDQEAIEAIRQILQNGRQQELAALEAGNLEAAAAIREAVAAQLAIYDDLIDNVHPERLEAVREFLNPYHETGLNALQQQSAMLGIPGPHGETEFDPNQITSRPSYQFVLDEGLKAVDRSASARTGALSGRAVKEAERYGAGLASQEFQNEFNRLGQITGTGLSAAQGLTQAVNQAYSDLYRVILGKAGLLGSEGEAIANLALSNAQGQIGISQNYNNSLLGLTGAEMQSQQNRLLRDQSALNNLINTGVTLAGIYGARTPTVTSTSGAGQDLNWPT